MINSEKTQGIAWVRRNCDPFYRNRWHFKRVSRSFRDIALMSKLRVWSCQTLTPLSRLPGLVALGGMFFSIRQNWPYKEPQPTVGLVMS